MSTQNMQVNTEEIHFKVQYGDEYRRFKLENATFSDLASRIKATFDLSEEDPIELKYKDEEGDAITISTESEFVFATELFAGKVLRLSIDLPNSKKFHPHHGGRGPWAEHHGRGGPLGEHHGRGGPWGSFPGRGGPWGQHHHGAGTWGQHQGTVPWGAPPGRGGPWGQHHGAGSWGELHGRGGPREEHNGRGRGGRGSGWKEHKAEWKMQKRAGKWADKLQANPEALNKKKQTLEWKLQTLQQRKAFFETGDKKNHPQAAQRVAGFSEKILRVEARLALLQNLKAVAASSVSEPAQVPVTPAGTDDMNTAQ